MGAETAEEAKKGFDQPLAVHEQWHIDFSYIKIQNSFYYFIGILDGYSRKMLNWRLCQNMGVTLKSLLCKRKNYTRKRQAPG